MTTFSLNLSERESLALEQLSEETELNKTAVLRQALRLYQTVHLRAKDGEQLAFTKNGVLVPVVAIGLPHFD